MGFLIILLLVFGPFLVWGAWLNKRKACAQRIRAAEFMSFGWRSEITPIEFEQRCAEALRLAGWHAETTKGSGDQGIDVYARRGAVSVVFQCKLYSHPVGNGAVQEAYAGARHRDANFAAVVTNSTYTPSAVELSGTTGVRLLHFRDLRHVNQLFGFPDVLPPNLENMPGSGRRPVRDFFRGLGDVRLGEPLYPSFRAKHRERLKDAATPAVQLQLKGIRAEMAQQLGLRPAEPERMTAGRILKIGGKVVACGVGFIFVLGVVAAIVGPPAPKPASQTAAAAPATGIPAAAVVVPADPVVPTQERIVATITNGRTRVDAQALQPKPSGGFGVLSSGRP